jgi:putative peptide zinc metalloprotease protein
VRLPKLRPDLVVKEVDTEGPSYVVKDPVTRRFFRLKAHEYFIARNLDGETPLEEIQARFESEFKVPLAMPALLRFIERTRALCLLEEGLTAAETARRQRGASAEERLATRLLQLKLKAVDPDRFLSVLLPYVRPFLTRGFLAVAGVLTAVAIGITIARWDVYTIQVRGFFRPEAIPTFILVAMVVTVLHELAHGFTCKRFGGEVHEMGFLLIYLMPAFYCNVSDSWLFKDRSQRLWVSAAGTVFQLFLYALAAIGWVFLKPDTWLSEACAMMIGIAGLTALLNFNPLIKLDGYYLLSDFLEMPNLRKRAFGYLGMKARSLFGRSRTEATEVEAREKWVYITYGLAAGVFSLGLVVVVLRRLVLLAISAFG